MARYSAAGRSTTTVPTSLQGPGVFASATGGRFVVQEVGVFNTTSVSAVAGIAVCTASGTQAGGLTEWCEDDPSAPAASETAFTQMSTNATLGAQVRQAPLGAAVGSGVIFTFPEQGLVLAEGVGNGIIINCPTGTGQHVDFYVVWFK